MQAIEMEEERSAAERCLEIISEGQPRRTLFELSFIDVGGCEMDKDYDGPTMETVDGKYQITVDFVRSMVQWFKDGKAMPRRYVWEIVLGARSQFIKEESLVDIRL